MRMRCPVAGCLDLLFHAPRGEVIVHGRREIHLDRLQDMEPHEWTQQISIWGSMLHCRTDDGEAS